MPFFVQVLLCLPIQLHRIGKVDALDILLAICRPSGCTVASGVVGVIVDVVVDDVCNRSQMRTSKCTCLIFGMSLGS